MASQSEPLWAEYGVEPKPCPDCGRDPVPLDEGPMEDPGAAAADHRPPLLALYCAGCKEILGTRYGYSWAAGVVPNVGI